MSTGKEKPLTRGQWKQEKIAHKQYLRLWSDRSNRIRVESRNIAGHRLCATGLMCWPAGSGIRRRSVHQCAIRQGATGARAAAFDLTPAHARRRACAADLAEDVNF